MKVCTNIFRILLIYNFTSHLYLYKKNLILYNFKNTGHLKTCIKLYFAFMIGFNFICYWIFSSFIKKSPQYA